MNIEFPKLRPLDVQPHQQSGQPPMLLLRDPLGLTDQMLAIPQQLAPLLALCDGMHDQVGILTALRVRWGIPITRQALREIVDTLDEACLLESERSAAAMAAALAAYRAEPSRPLTLAGGGYPADPSALSDYLEAFDPADRLLAEPSSHNGIVRGLISPHIDYSRGGPIYRAAWQAASAAARSADLAIIFGTDHSGGLGRVTLTQQSYATPYGVLPNALGVTGAVADALGEEDAYAEELHHRHEHSIELAAVWLHHVRQGNPIEVVPILCGSFAHFVAGQADPAHDTRIAKTIDALTGATGGRSVLVIAAADLAHIGPAFGGAPAHAEQRAVLRRADEALLAQMSAGDAEGFFGALRDVGDRNNVCGLPPIYMALRFLGDVRGAAVAYDQCPADDRNTSWVSVAGLVWH